MSSLQKIVLPSLMAVLVNFKGDRQKPPGGAVLSPTDASAIGDIGSHRTQDLWHTSPTTKRTVWYESGPLVTSFPALLAKINGKLEPLGHHPVHAPSHTETGQPLATREVGADLRPRSRSFARVGRERHDLARKVAPVGRG